MPFLSLTYNSSSCYFNNLGSEQRSSLAWCTLDTKTDQSLSGIRIWFSFQSHSSYSFQPEEIIASWASSQQGKECKPLFTSFSPVAGTLCSPNQVHFWEIAQLQFKSIGQLNWNWLFQSLRIWFFLHIIQMDKWNGNTYPGHSACSSPGLWLLLSPSS